MFAQRIDWLKCARDSVIDLSLFIVGSALCACTPGWLINLSPLYWIDSTHSLVRAADWFSWLVLCLCTLCNTNEHLSDWLINLSPRCWIDTFVMHIRLIYWSYSFFTNTTLMFSHGKIDSPSFSRCAKLMHSCLIWTFWSTSSSYSCSFSSSSSSSSCSSSFSSSLRNSRALLLFVLKP